MDGSLKATWIRIQMEIPETCEYSLLASSQSAFSTLTPYIAIYSKTESSRFLPYLCGRLSESKIGVKSKWSSRTTPHANSHASTQNTSSSAVPRANEDLIMTERDSPLAQQQRGMAPDSPGPCRVDKPQGAFHLRLARRTTPSHRLCGMES